MGTLLYLLIFFFIIHSKTGTILYKAQSQDEDALVQAAAQLHMVFYNKNANLLGTTFVLCNDILYSTDDRVHVGLMSNR